MAFRAIIGFLASLLIGTAALAEDVVLNPSHPQRYTVVKGDTLWDIAGRFLRDPWMWPKVWKDNPHIGNPHLIYPGDEIVLTYVGGVPQLGLSGDSLRSRDVRLSPQIRITPIEEAIPVIPIKLIAPFLTSPRITTEQEMAWAPYVVEFAGEHLVAGGGDRIYVRSIPTAEISAFTVYRPGNLYKDPETQEILGYQAIYVADTQLDRVGDPATLTVTKSAGEVRRGDRLLPNSEEQISLQFRPHAPDKVISGHIIDVLEGVSQIGQYNIVVLNRGLRDGVETGHVFDIFRSGRVVRDDFGGKPNMTVQLPDEEAGRLMVFRTFERVSFALVMDATSAINLFDTVKTP